MRIVACIYVYVCINMYIYICNTYMVDLMCWLFVMGTTTLLMV